MRILEKYLSDPKRKIMLDISCGTGRLSRMFSDRGALVTDFDFSPRSIEIDRNIVSKNNPHYRVASVFQLDEEERYDVAFTWGVLTVACRDRAQLVNALQRISRSLQNEGKLFLLEPVHRGFLHRVLDMDIGEFTKEIREAGFEVIALEDLHFWPMRLALAYVQWPEFIADAGFTMGQWLSKIFNNCGDYKVIYARKIT